MASRTFRTDNLRFLVMNIYPGQSALARKLQQRVLRQRTISRILDRTSPRRFSDREVKIVEQKLDIPDGWMDKFQFEQAWPYVKLYQKFPGEFRSPLREIVQFVCEKREQ